MSRVGKISIAGTVLLVTAVLYLILPLYSARVNQFTFTCSFVNLLLNDGFKHAGFIHVVQYLLPLILLILAGSFAMGGKMKYKYVVVGLAAAALASLLWVIFDLSMIENFLDTIDFGSANVKDGSGVGLIVCILAVLWSGVTVLLAKKKSTF